MMTAPMAREVREKWIEVCMIDDLIDGEAQVFKINGYEVYVILSDGKIYVYYGRCPHAFGEFAPSDFKGDRVICNVHQWEFDHKTGISINPKGSCLYKFEHKVEDGKLYVKIPNVPVIEFKEKYFKMYQEGGI